MGEVMLYEPHVVYWRHVDKCLSQYGISHHASILQAADHSASGYGVPVPTRRRALLGTLLRALEDYGVHLLSSTKGKCVQVWREWCAVVHTLVRPARGEGEGEGKGEGEEDTNELNKVVRATTGLTDADLWKLQHAVALGRMLGLRLSIITLPNTEVLNALYTNSEFRKATVTIVSYTAGGWTEASIPNLTPCVYATLFLYQKQLYVLEPEHTTTVNQTTPAHVPLRRITTLSWHPLHQPMAKNTVYAMRTGATGPQITRLGSLNPIIPKDDAAGWLYQFHMVALDVRCIVASCEGGLLCHTLYSPSVKVPTLDRLDRFAVAICPAMQLHPLASAPGPPAHSKTAMPLAMVRIHSGTGCVPITFRLDFNTYYKATGSTTVRVYIVESSEYQCPPVGEIAAECVRNMTE